MNRTERRIRRKAIAETVKKGAAIDETAYRFKVSEQTVRASCKEFSVALPSRVKRTHLSVVSKLLKGQSEVSISEELGVSTQYVNAVKMRARNAGFQI